jgi:hypothetical protein
MKRTYAILIIAGCLSALAGATAPASGQILGEREASPSVVIDVGVRANWNGILLRGSLTLDRAAGASGETAGGTISQAGSPPEKAAGFAPRIPRWMKRHFIVCRAVRRALICAARLGIREALHEHHSGEGR